MDEPPDIVHVMPVRDLIEHVCSADCPCGPTPSGDGRVLTHHSLDGREFSEPDYSGPPMPREA